jgi:hypothetical protein
MCSEPRLNDALSKPLGIYGEAGRWFAKFLLPGVAALIWGSIKSDEHQLNNRLRQDSGCRHYSGRDLEWTQGMRHGLGTRAGGVRCQRS